MGETNEKYLDLAKSVLKDEDWFRAKSLSDRDLYLWELAATIEETVEDELRHYRKGDR